MLINEKLYKIIGETSVYSAYDTEDKKTIYYNYIDSHKVRYWIKEEINGQ